MKDQVEQARENLIALRSKGAQGDTEMGRKYGAWLERRALAFADASHRYFKAKDSKKV
jgi:hypothetical protein